MRNRINEINVTISDRDTDVSGCNWDGAFWHWTVEFDREGKHFTVPYYGGKAVEEVSEEEVLHSCLLDALAYSQCDTFKDFCSSFGYEIFDDDGYYSKESKKTYNLCEKMLYNFCRILDIADYAFEDVACEWLNEHDI